MAASPAQLKLHKAVIILAAGSGSLRERLNEAWRYCLADIRGHDFVRSEDRDEFLTLVRTFSGGGRFDIELAQLPESDLQRFVEGISTNLRHRTTKRVAGPSTFASRYPAARASPNSTQEPQTR